MNATRSRPRSLRHARGGLALQMAAMFMLFGLLGAVMTGYFMWRDWKILSWPSASGRIVKSWVGETSQSKNNRTVRMYTPRVWYVYRAGADPKELEGETISTLQTSSSEREWAESIVASYAVGAAVKVFYDPERPGESLLEPSLHFWYHLLFVGVSLLFLGLAGIMIGFRREIDSPANKKENSI